MRANRDEPARSLVCALRAARDNWRAQPLKVSWIGPAVTGAPKHPSTPKAGCGCDQCELTSLCLRLFVRAPQQNPTLKRDLRLTVPPCRPLGSQGPQQTASRCGVPDGDVSPLHSRFRSHTTRSARR